MTASKIQRMKITGRLVLTKGQFFWHYSIILLLLVSPIYTTIVVLKYYVLHTYDGVRTIQEMISAGYIWIIPAIAVYFFQKRRLKFRVITLSVSPKQFRMAVEQTTKELEWKIEEESNNFIIARSGFSYRSWGELITIIREDDRILFNSICDPDNKPSIASFGMNRLNRKLFEKELMKIVTKNSIPE